MQVNVYWHFESRFSLKHIQSKTKLLPAATAAVMKEIGWCKNLNYN